MVTYQPEQDPTANNWNLLRAIPNAPAWNPGNTPDMVISKVLNALYNDGATGTTSFADLTGQPTDNAALKATLGLYLLASNNLSDIPSKSAAQHNLGLGSAATLNAPMSGNATGGQVVLATDTRLNNSRVPVVGSIIGTVNQVNVAEASNVFEISLASAIIGVNSVTDVNSACMVDIANHQLILIGAAVPSLDWGACTLFNPATGITVDWQNYLLNDGSVALSVNWALRQLHGNGIVSIDWNASLINDAAGLLSVDYGDRLLVANDGATTVLNWSTTAAAVTSISTLGFAPLASPAFTGTPTAPTPAPGDNSTNIATTAFVAAASSGVSSLAGTANQIVASAATGAVTLSLSTSLVLPSGSTATTQSPGDNSTKVATTAFVAAASTPPAYLGKITGCNLNASAPADNACTISAAKYILRKIVITNASTSLAALSPVMAVYDAAAGTGDLLASIPAAAFNLLTAAAKFIQYIGNELVIMLTGAFALAEFCSENTLSASTLYARLTTAAGSAATCDIYFYGDTL